MGDEEGGSLSNWLEVIRRLPYREAHNMFATLLWSAWYARNLLIFQNKVLAPIDCFQIAQRALWMKPISSSHGNGLPRSLVCSRHGQIKVRCDAAFALGEGMGFGIVIMDDESKPRDCRYGFRPGAVSVMEGEAIAVWESLKLCIERGLNDVIIETDCQRLYWCLMSKNHDLSYLGATLDNIFAAATTLQRCSFSWSSREGNEDADRLAKFALCNRLFLSPVEDFPSLLNSV